MNSLFSQQIAQVENLIFKTFLNDYVAKRYGVSEATIRSHKKLHADEIVENIHFVTKTNKFGTNETKWTLRGIIKLGMFIRSPQAKAFRLWAEQELEKSINAELEKARLTQEQNLMLENELSNLEKRNKAVALGYKSQLAQQKEKYELQIKSLKCELEHGQKIDFKKGIDKDLKRQLAERGYLLMNLADFHSLGEGLAARMFEGLGQIFGKHYPPCLKQLPILHFYGATDYYNVKIHNNLGNTPQRAWGVNVGVLNAKLKPVDKIYSPIYGKWVIEDGEQIAGWELGCELKWKGNTKIQHGS